MGLRPTRAGDGTDGDRRGRILGKSPEYGNLSDWGRTSGVERLMPENALQASRPEVWLRGNMRPVLLAAGASVLSGGLILAAFVVFQAPAWLVIAVSVLLAVGTATTVAVAVESARPRLARRGNQLLVRLAPWQLEAVPLDVLECFFLGSSPVGSHPATSACGESDAASAETTASSDQPSRRRGTLAIRLAERSVVYVQRSASLPWGGWARGTIVVDGLWCEPLTAALVRDLTSRLVAAKREAL